MKIRRLEIQGFKSFADRTVLRFGEGITGVVGPNGCGKSNIVDAIRWVMGEQSAKHLRGAGMQDVIFAGSDARGPMGMSEVTISFKNDGQLVPPQYAKMEEISVTRRLFRDGTSEYAINKVPCRLRDILDLFMGTGIGKNAYSIIEQGRIGLIVTAKPEDRRAIIEDAAGVSRYKARRKQAERRIQATEQNLLRITDITDELDGRLKSLERQAKKAEKYKRIKSELRDLDLHAAAHAYLERSVLERYEARKVAELKALVEADEKAIAEDEARIAAEMEVLEHREAELREAELQAAEQAQALALAKNNAAFLGRERDTLSARRAEAQAEQTDLTAELATLKEEQAEAEAVGNDLEASGGAEVNALDEAEARQKELQEGLTKARKALDDEKQAMVSALTTIAEQKNNLANLARAQNELEAQLDRALGVKKAAAERAREAQKKAKEVKKSLDGNRQLKLSLDDERANQELLVAELKTQKAETDTQLQATRDELISKRHRLQTLLDIQKNYEGCTDAVRQIMREKGADSHIGSSLHGLVADVLSAEPRYEAAVEAVLGDRLQYVIVNSQDDSVASVNYLKDAQLGRSSFIPLDLREDHVSWVPRNVTSRPPSSAEVRHPVPEPVGEPMAAAAATQVAGGGEGMSVELPTAAPQPLSLINPATGVTTQTFLPPGADDLAWEALDLWPRLDANGVCGKMVDLVKAQPGYEHVARVLLGDVVVVENLDTARDIWVNNGHLKTLVTLSGEVLDPVGVLTGGSGEGKAAGMLAQKREIKDLQDSAHTLEAKVELAKERFNTLAQRLEDAQKHVARLADDRHKEELSIVNLERDLRRFEEEAEREQTEVNARTDEVELLRRKLASIDEETGASQTSVQDLEGGQAEAEARVQARSQEVTRLSEALAALSESLTDLKVTAAANRERRDSSRRNLARIIQRMKDVEHRLVRLAEVLAESEQELGRLGERIEEAHTEATRLDAEVTAKKAELAEARSALEADLHALKAEDAALRDTRARIDHNKDEASGAAMKVREHQLGQEKLVEQVEERYRANLLELVVEYHGAPPQSPEDADTANKLRKQLDGIGAINLTAIEEYEEVKQRFEFLSGQKKDLEEAIASLKAAIRRINKTSKERYVEAFRMVNEKFQQIFPKLFNGGRCALVLTDESDPLESGIEVLAQPPGKKLQSVNLLSGGEKALTAVALIFGIFLIKPTPFCLLDEVDAPLDEANVGRYNEMLREMSAISQFILITHNKRTMELPDRLYGVTMEDPGVSKIVPVDVRESSSDLPAAAS
ncbi:MAG: chromosome segregation protein SMC [Deltaproteobacteria bacterium]|nr:chromosome segregation protein SMC [Deltaproteobacteria bacterium]